MNSNNIFCVTSVNSVGCTFLDWSIYWLSGQEDFFCIENDRHTKIVSDPLKFGEVSNAHGHRRNICAGEIKTKQDIERIRANRKENILSSIYCEPEHIDDCCDRLSISKKNLKEKIDFVENVRKKEYVDLLRWVVENQKIPTIFINFDTSTIGYNWTKRSLDKKMFSSDTLKSMEEYEHQFNEIFFTDSLDKWKDAEIWDLREKLALNFRPFDTKFFMQPTFSFPHLWINCQDLWFDTERTLISVMEYLGISIEESRIDHWRSIAKRWQMIHNDNLKFPRLLSQIVAATVNGHYQEIPDLTLKQEAIIQHCLIYHHGMNLKTWNLKKFPKNTLELHKLLEPNIHPLSLER